MTGKRHIPELPSHDGVGTAAEGDTMTVHRAARAAGVSVRTLHHYDRIGLLQPSGRSAAGYRLYAREDLVRLQQILLFRELGLKLEHIAAIMGADGFDRRRALEEQLQALRAQRKRLDGIIAHAEALLEGKDELMDFTAFDRTQLDDYAARAKERWGDTEAWAAYEAKGGVPAGKEQDVAKEFMGLFAQFGKLLAAGEDPVGEAAKAQVRALQAYITAHFYTCTDEILAGLGKMYAADGEFSRNIDAAGGEGTAAFASAAIEAALREPRRDGASRRPCCARRASRPKPATRNAAPQQAQENANGAHPGAAPSLPEMKTAPDGAPSYSRGAGERT